MSIKSSSRLLVIIAVFALLIVLAVVAPGASSDGDGDQFDIPEKADLKYPQLDSHLNQLVAMLEEGGLSAQEAAADSAIHSGGSVAVTIYLSDNLEATVSFLEDFGGDPRNVGEDYIEAYVPVQLLGQLSEQSGVLRVREIVPPQPVQISQLITGRGPLAHGSPAWNQAGYSGQGVKVGIIDIGFKDFTSLIGTELPARVHGRCYTDVGVVTHNLADCEAVRPVTVRIPECHDTAQRLAVRNAIHGTIVAESLIDMAPQASLYIANPKSKADLQDAADWMASQGVSVINHSVGWVLDGPGDGTSPLSASPLRTVDRAVERDIIWVNSAGNGAQETWFGGHSDPDGNGAIGFGGQNDEVVDMRVRKCRSSVVQLRWEDNWDGASTDLDLHLYNKDTEEIVFSSATEQSGESGHVPYEGFSFRSGIDSEALGIAVTHHGGGVPDWIQLVVWAVDPIQHHTGSGSITNPAESTNPGMLAVGASPWYDVYTIEPFSSRGPTPDGRVKPDIVAADCGETALIPLNENNRAFCGTSQASPHVAGLAALVRQRFPGHSPVRVAEYLKEYAENREAVPNNTWGYGFARLPAYDPCLGALGEMTGRVEAVDGTWAAGCDSKVADRGHAQYYSFTLAQESKVTITLESQDADTYLYLREGETRSGAFILENDDHLGSTAVSHILGTLPAGTYTIEATTYYIGQTGSFTITVSGSPTTGPGFPHHTCVDNLGQLSFDARHHGSWSYHCPSNNRQGHYAHFYTFNLPFQAEVGILLESDVDTYLYLMEDAGKDGDVLAENDDVEAGNTNSAVTVPLASGTYTIEATTYAEGKRGDFTVTVSGLGAAPHIPCIVGNTLSPGDRCGYHNFTIEVDESGELLVRFPGDTAEADLDNFSLVRNGNSWIIAELP